MSQRKIKLKNELSERLLAAPWEFRRIIRDTPKKDPLRIKLSEDSSSDEKINFGSVLREIENSHFKEDFEVFAKEEIYEIFQEFEKKIEIIKKYILNSEVRVKTFYHLGIKGKATSTEIADLIEKHPKSTSKYINEFKKKDWVGDPEEVGREKRYSLTEKGISFFNLAVNRGWFKNIIKEELPIEQTIISFSYSELVSEWELLDDNSKYSFPEDYIKAVFSEDEVNYYFGYIESPSDLPPPSDLIDKILSLAEAMKKKIGMDVDLPKIVSIGDRSKISLDTVDNDKLALIFGAFNYLKKNKIRLGEAWEISRIKIITVNSYFDIDVPDIHQRKGFMTFDETEEFIKKVLRNFKEKLNQKGINQ